MSITLERAEMGLNQPDRDMEPLHSADQPLSYSVPASATNIRRAHGQVVDKRSCCGDRGSRAKIRGPFCLCFLEIT